MPTLLRILPYVVYALLAGYVIAWAVLLALCWRRRRFYPLLGDDRRTRWFWLASFVFLNPILTLLYLWFGQLRRPDARDVRIGAVPAGLAVVVVAVAGFFVNFPGVTHLWMVPFQGAPPDDPGRRAALSAHAATIESRSSTSTTMVSTSGTHARVACRTVAIVVEHDHALVRLVGEALRERLAAIPFVESVSLHADGRFPKDGQRRPDVFVRLGAGSIRVLPVPYVVSLTAEINVDAGRHPWRSVNTYNYGTDPPLVTFHLGATIGHKSRTVGYESVRHSLAAKDIAKEIAGGLLAKLEEFRAKSGPLPELPAALYGTYRPAKLPAPLAKLPCRRLCSYSGLLTHNETVWRFETPRDGVAALLKRLGEEMQADAWRRRSGGKRSLRMDRDAARVHVYRLAERVRTGWVVVKPGAAKPPATMIVHLTERFAEQDRRDALEGLLAEATPVDTLLFLSSLFDRDQRRRMYELFEKRTGPSLPAQVELVQHYLAEKDYPKARAALRRGRAILQGAWEADDCRSRLDKSAAKLAKALGDETLKKPAPPTPEDFRAAGFREVDANTQPFELAVGLDQPVALFYVGEGDKPCTVTARATRPATATPRTPYDWHCVETYARGGRGKGGSPGGPVSDGTWSASHTWSPDRRMTVGLRVNSTRQKDRFTVAVRVQARPAGRSGR